MAFSDVIDDYTQGQTGTLTDGDGQSVTYTITDGANTFNQTNHGNHSAQIDAQGDETLVVTFDQPIVGAAIAVYGSDSDEFYTIIVDGVEVDLNELIANGDVTFSNVGTVATHTINEDGTISGGAYTDGSIANLVFNIPVTSLGAVGAGTTATEYQADGFEIGIDSVSFDVVCFVSGTTILTPDGLKPVEELRIGDLVRTIDNVDKPIRWIGSRRFDGQTLRRNVNLHPVRITAGALGNGLPQQDLSVSRQHRVLVSSKIVENMFGVSDVLIPAIKLTSMPGIFVDHGVIEVRYFHFMLDTHNVVFAHGAATESLYPGPQGLKSLTPEARTEILTIFPECAQWDHVPEQVCLVPTAKKQKQLIERHSKNRRPLSEPRHRQTV